MKTVFKLNAEDVNMLTDSIMKLPNLAEDIMNDYLHNNGANIVITEITKEMPVGIHDNKKSKGYPRTHAKYSVSLEFIKINLGFAIKTTKTPFFGYLYFPSYAEGTSKRNMPNLFFEKGVDKGKNTIITELKELLDKKMKERLKNGS